MLGAFSTARTSCNADAYGYESSTPRRASPIHHRDKRPISCYTRKTCCLKHSLHWHRIQHIAAAWKTGGGCRQRLERCAGPCARGACAGAVGQTAFVD